MVLRPGPRCSVPWVARTERPRLLTSVYVFLGGGGLTAESRRGAAGLRDPVRDPAGACLPIEWEQATVGQGTRGLGWDLISLAENVGLFTELAGYVYDSPFHTGPGLDRPARERHGHVRPHRPPDGGPEALASATARRWSWLRRCRRLRRRPPAGSPAPPPPPATRDIRVCVVQGTGLHERGRPRSTRRAGDTTVCGPGALAGATRPPRRRTRRGAPGTSTTTRSRSTNNEYVKFGVPRVITNPTS